MRVNFGDTSIIVGHIKELLHSFNLPMVPVYTDTTKLYDNRTYIKDDYVVKYSNGKFTKITPYAYNIPILNLTKNLIINSSDYDSYTHKYLGDYLRFLRDYRHLNLMGMYNCFSNEKIRRIERSWNINGRIFSIDTNDQNKYYSIPIKFNQLYTISLECDAKFQYACILHNDVSVSSNQDDLVTESFNIVDGSKFTNPFIISTEFNCAKDMWMKEKDLRLIFKLPPSFNSSITVLEGNFLPAGNVVDGNFITAFYRGDEDLDIYYSKNSLLYVNDRSIRPFADRLIEYLTGNAITNIDYISNNVKRVQDAVFKKSKFEGFYGLWDDTLRQNVYNMFFNYDTTKGTKRYINKIETNIQINKNIPNVDKVQYILYAPNLRDTQGVIIDLMSGVNYTLKENDVLYVRTLNKVEILEPLENSDGTVILDSSGNVIYKEIYDSEGNPSYPVEYEYSTFKEYKSNSNYTVSISANTILKDSSGSDTQINILNNKAKVASYEIIYNSEGRIENEFDDLDEDITINVTTSSSKREVKRFIDSYYDLYGYVDKDVESLLRLQ